MTEPNQRPPADPGNMLLTEVPSELSATVIDTPAGQRLMVTVRTPSTTLTLFLQKQMGESWIKVLQDTTGRMTSLTVAPANVQLPKIHGKSIPFGG